MYQRRRREELEEEKRKEENKLFTRVKQFLTLFDVDTTKWDKKRAVKWILTKLVLILIVLGLGFYTLQTSWNLIQDYVQLPTSFIQKTMFNESISLPPSIVSLPLSPYELDDYWADQTNISYSDNETHYQNLLIAFFDNETTTKESILSEDNPWPNYLLFTTCPYLRFFMQFEALNGKEAIQIIDALNDSYSDLAASVTILDDRLKYLNISIHELKAKFGAEIRVLFNLTVFHRTSSLEVIEIEIDSRHFSFHEGFIWYNAPFDQHPLKDGEFIQIQAQRSYLPNPFPDFQFYMTVGIGGSSDDQYDYWNSDFDSSVYFVPFQVTSTFRSLSNLGGEQRCSENKSIDFCKSECRRDYFRQTCGCIPTFGHTESAYNESACNLKNYMTCSDDKNRMDHAKAQEHLIDCETSCLHMCERTTYTVPKDADYHYLLEDPLYFEANYSVMRLIITQFHYPFFNETMKWKFPSFFGTIGGAIGLWLGINVWDSIVYAVTIIKMMAKVWKRKTAQEKAENSEQRLVQNSDATRDAAESGALSYWERKARIINKSCAFCNQVLKWAVPIYFADILLSILLGFFSLIFTGLALKEYMSQNTTTNVIVDHHESIEFPASTICLPLEFGELDYFYSLGKQKLGSSLNEYLNNQSITKDYLLSDNEYWDNTIRNVAHAYLINITNCEYGYLCNRAHMGDRDSATAMDTLGISMSKLNISVDELRQKFGREVAALYSFNVALYEFDKWVENITLIRTNFIDEGLICYEIQFNLYPLKVSNFFEISVSRNSLPSPRYWDSAEYQFEVFFGKQFRTLNLPEESSINPYSGYMITYTVELTKYRVLREVKNGEIRCNEQTLEECELICRIKFIQDQCKCLPTLWPGLLNNFNRTDTDLCDSLEKYQSCSYINGLHESEEKCVQQCHRPCERMTVKVKNSINFDYNNMTQVVLLFDNMNIVTFEEQLTWDKEQFLGIIGGTVDFLLAFSLFDIVCLAFVLSMRLFMAVLKRAEAAFKKKSQRAVVEVNPASSTSDNEAAGPSSKNQDGNGSKNLIQKFKSMGWGVDKPQRIIEHIFKLVVIIIFGYLTMKMCIPIIQQYKEGSTHSVISVVINKSLYLKPATLCIDLYPDELDGMVQSDSSDSSSAGYEAGIRYFFKQSNITKEYFLGSVSWPNTLLYITYSYFSSISEFESVIHKTRYDLTLSSVKNSTLPYLYEKWGWGKDKYTAMILLEKYMILLNISANELRQRLGVEVAKIFSIKANQTTNCQGYAVCQNATDIPIGEVTSIDSGSICYRMPLNYYPFNHSKQILRVAANDNTLRNELISSDNRTMQISLSGANNSNLNNRIFENSYVADSTFVDRNVYRISVSTIYQSMISLGKCSEYKTHENCLSECRVALFRQMCNCTPLTWSNWTSSDDYEVCKLSNHTKCANYSGDDDIQCVNETCVTQGDLCERWIFDVQYTAWLPNPTGAYIELQAGSFDYPVFTEEYELKFEEFIGNLGGALGFYLGLDLMGILLIFGEIIAFIAEHWLAYIKKVNESVIVV